MKHLLPDFYLNKCSVHQVLLAAAVAVTIVLTPFNVQAQDSTGENWVWQTTVYGWLPTIEGSTQFSDDSGGSGITVDPDQIIDNLKLTFMGTLKARKGSWGMFTDVLYLNVGDSKKSFRDLTIGPAELPANITAKVDFDLKSWVWTVAGTYNLSATPQHESGLLFGARMVDMDQTLGWTFNGDVGQLPLPERSGSSTVSATEWDAIIGVTGHAFIGDDSRWFVPYYVDVGTGDSDLTWQAMTGLGYQFDWGAMVLTYRYLDYNLDSNSPVTDLSFGGPMMGVAFQW